MTGIVESLRRLRGELMAGNLSTVLTRYSDVGLALVVIAVIGIMIVPLPPFLLDLFLATNITLAVTLLMITLYVPNALALASFPTLLLVTTLFRLSLNVSSTRLILLYGYAGDMIQSFGNFVVQGDFVVGFVIFLILTLIQFIVIAKGSERVSEVAARFTLDALPGKQMSIDADLRAGLIDADEARSRREYLGRESQFYGAMDGAMKFVKGDAIASIIVSVINVAAGLAIGVAVRGYEVGAAVKTYTLLTIGDGLISQIPSLIIATSAGILTTRVAAATRADGRPVSLGEEIGTQILAQPKAIAIAGCMLAALGLIPGLPLVPFLALSALTVGTAWGLTRTQQQKEKEAVKAEVMGDGDGGDEAPRLPLAVPVMLETSPAVTPLVDVTAEGSRFVQELLPQMRDWLFQELGVVFPGVKVRGDAAYLEADSYVVHVNEVPAAVGRAYRGRVFLREHLQQVSLMGIEGVAAPLPAGEGQGLWVDAEAATALPAGMGAPMDADEYMAVHVAEVLKGHVDELLGIQDVQNVLDQLSAQGFEALVESVVPKQLSVQRLTDVLRRLLREGLSIKNMQLILETLAQWAPFESDPVYLTEHVRKGLKHYIAFQHTGGQSTLAVHLLDPRIEELIYRGIETTASGSTLSLDPATSRAVLDAFRGALGHLPAGVKPVVLTQSEVRYFVKRLLDFELPGVTVLSFQELPSELQIQPVGRIEPPPELANPESGAGGVAMAS
ncbi:MAG: type III secretion system export apparatus subunit SctV [Acidobacteriota bacterium]